MQTILLIAAQISGLFPASAHLSHSLLFPGIKYNCENGGPAPESLTDAIFDVTKSISSLRICTAFPHVDISTLSRHTVTSDDHSFSVLVDVISTTSAHVALLKTIFDFDAIKALFARSDFSFRYDCMHGVQGPYAHEVFVNELGEWFWLVCIVVSGVFSNGRLNHALLVSL